LLEQPRLRKRKQSQRKSNEVVDNKKDKDYVTLEPEAKKLKSNHNNKKEGRKT